MANADIVRRDIRMTGKDCTRMVQTCDAMPGVSLLSAKRGKAIGKPWNSYRRNVLYADGVDKSQIEPSPTPSRGALEELPPHIPR